MSTPAIFDFDEIRKRMPSAPIAERGTDNGVDIATSKAPKPWAPFKPAAPGSRETVPNPPSDYTWGY